MKLGRRLCVGAMVVTAVAPCAVSAQVLGTVTTSPLSAGAPALGMPMLLLLALVLGIVGAVYVTRRKVPRAIAGLAVVAASILFAGMAYAPIASVGVSGAQCTMRTTQTWNADGVTTLNNECSNPLLIDTFDTDCGTGTFASTPACVVGQTLDAGTSCFLPECPC